MDDQLQAFTVKAQRYCEFVESRYTGDSYTFAKRCLIELVDLYQAGLQLATVFPANDDLLETVDENLETQVRENLKDNLPRDLYWVIFEPHSEEPEEAVVGSLVDDLGDIWRDLKPGVIAMANATEEVTRDIAWEWQQSFETHWGRHAVDAIGALHKL